MQAACNQFGMSTVQLLDHLRLNVKQHVMTIEPDSLSLTATLYPVARIVEFPKIPIVTAIALVANVNLSAFESQSGA